MKKISILALAMVLTAVLFAGCRGRNHAVTPTVPANTPVTHPTTAPTTEATHPSTQATENTVHPSETVDHGNGPVNGTEEHNGTTATSSTEATTEGRAANPRAK